MKRVILVLCALLLLCSCSRENKVSIEDFSWKLESAFDKNGVSLSFDEVILTAKNGEFTISEKERVYEGKYYNAKKDPRSIIYEIEIENVKGLASTSYTYYKNEENKPTLVMKTDEYSMIFSK